MYLLYKLKSKLLPISTYSHSITTVFDSAGATHAKKWVMFTFRGSASWLYFCIYKIGAQLWKSELV